MHIEKTLVERAFELARNGTCASVADIRKRLLRDGFGGLQVELHMSSGGLRKQLKHLCEAAACDAG